MTTRGANPKTYSNSNRHGSLRAPLAVLALGALLFFAGLTGQRFRKNPGVPVPDDLATLEPVLRSAIHTHAEAVRARPTDPQAHGQLALFYEAHGYPELAARSYTNAVAADETAPRWRYHRSVLQLEAGDVLTAERDLRYVIARQPDYAPAHHRLGLLMLERSAHEEAAQSFQQVVELRPNEVQGYVSLARALLELGRDQEAVDCLSKALSITPNAPEVHYLLGRAYRQLGRDKEAEAALGRGARAGQPVVRDPWREALAPIRLTKWMRMDQASDLMAEGKVASAVEAFERLLVDYPRDQDVMNRLAIGYSQLDRLPDAERVLAESRQVNDDHAPTHVNLALLRGRQENMAAALQHVEKAIALAPRNARAYLARGQLQLRLGKLQEALESFREAVRLDPTNPDAHSAIGLTLVNLGRWEDAIEAYEDAVKLRPRSADDRYRLALLYHRAGRVDEARRMLRIAYEQAPNDPQIRKAMERFGGSSGGGGRARGRIH